VFATLLVVWQWSRTYWHINAACTTCRLGAAKALAKMADKLAIERDLVSAYLLEALTQALHALQLAEHDPRGTGTRAQLADAIKVTAFHHLSMDQIPNIK